MHISTTSVYQDECQLDQDNQSKDADEDQNMMFSEVASVSYEICVKTLPLVTARLWNATPPEICLKNKSQSFAKFLSTGL